jgi:hypothetical protein
MRPMLAMRLWAGGVVAMLLLAFVLVAPAVNAKGGSEPDFIMQGGGGFTSGETMDALVFEGGLLGGFHVLRAGALAQVATSFGGTFAGFGGVVGLGVNFQRVHFMLLGEFGVHEYSGIGSSWLGSDPGARATLGYAGGRASIGFPMVRGGRADVALTTFAFWNTDLARVERSYEFVSQSFVCLNACSGGFRTSTAAVGQVQWGLALGVTATFNRQAPSRIEATNP